MDEDIKKQLLERKYKIIHMVIERAKRDFPEDIAIIALTGSFHTGDFHEKSDVDLIIINNTDRGWDISSTFILGDIGYDIYCTPWNQRIEQEASLKSPMVSSLIDIDVLYCAKPEYMDKLHEYQQRALDLLAKPIGEECLSRTAYWMGEAKKAYADVYLKDTIGEVRYASAHICYCIVNAIVSMNNTYIKRGVKRYLEEVLSCKYVPEHYEETYESMIHAKSILDLKQSAGAMLKSTDMLYQKMVDEFIEKPTPNKENIKGIYEEVYCNYKNKLMMGVRHESENEVFLAAMGAQNYFDEMTREKGMKKYDIMQFYDPENLNLIYEEFLKIADEYEDVYQKLGREVKRYKTMEELEADYLGK